METQVDRSLVTLRNDVVTAAMQWRVGNGSEVTLSKVCDALLTLERSDAFWRNILQHDELARLSLNLSEVQDKFFLEDNVQVATWWATEEGRLLAMIERLEADMAR